MFSRSGRARRAFTLVELLVVIGIIALLISILMPALTKARNQALAIKCGNQVRQIYMACAMFAQDNKGHLPRASVGPPNDPTGRLDSERTCAFTARPGSEWGILDYSKGVLVPYIPGGNDVRKDTFYCPGDLGEKTQGGGAAPMNDDRNFSYSMNAHVNRPDKLNAAGQLERVTGIRLSSVKHASAKIYLFEEQAPNDMWCLLWDTTDTVTTPHPFRPDDILSARHAGQRYVMADRNTQPGTSDWRAYSNGRASYGFFDGHVEILSPADIYRRPKYFMLNVPE